jgi:hypothetical protein
MTRFIRNPVSKLGALVLALCVSGPLAASPSNKWRVECSGNAESDGVIVFTIAPVGATPLEVRVTVSKGTGENAVARTIRDAFKAQLPEDGYHTETDDGEDVLLKKKSRAADFDLKIESNTVKHLRLNLDRE